MKTDTNIDFCSLYLNWIKQNIEQFKVNNNTFRLTLPFLDRNNDEIEIYIIQKDDGTFYITEDVYKRQTSSITTASVSGVFLETVIVLSSKATAFSIAVDSIGSIDIGAYFNALINTVFSAILT